MAVISFMCSACTGIQIYRIYCLLTALAEVQAVDKNASFLFVGHVNAQRVFSSSTMNFLGRAVQDFVSSSGCNQVVT